MGILLMETIDQGRKHLQVFVGVALLVLMDLLLKYMNPFPNLPSPLIGMCIVIACGIFVKYNYPEETLGAIMDHCRPALEFITHKYLSLFYSPALVTLPLALGKISAGDIVSSLILIITGCSFTAIFTGYSVLIVRRCFNDKTPIQYSEEKDDIEFNKRFISSCSGIAIASLVLTCWSANMHTSELQQGGMFLVLVVISQLSLTLTGYIVGVSLPKKVRRWLHPMICCALLPNFGALLLGFLSPIPYEDWLSKYLPGDSGFGAGSILFLFLGPIIISFGFGIVQKWDVLIHHKLEVFLCCFLSAGCTMLSTAFLCGALSIDQIVGKSLLSRGVTLALALPITKTFGGITEITAAAVAGTGLIGGNFILWFMSLLKFQDVIVRGITAAAVAHGLGTAAIGSVEPDALPYAGLSYLICGVSGVLWTLAVPGFKELLLHLIS